MWYSIRRKMFLGLMTVVIAFVVVVNLILHYLLSDIAFQEIKHGLENSVLAYHRFDEQRMDLMLTQANSMAQTAHLKATLTIPDVDKETIYYAGIGLKEIADTELMLIISESGELLTDLNDKSLPRNSLISLPGIETALNGGNHYGIWEYNQHFFRVAISPIIVGEQIVGLITIGERLDNPETIELAQDIAGAQVLLSINEKVFTAKTKRVPRGKVTADLKSLSSASQTGKLIGNIEGVKLALVTIAGEPFFTATIQHPDGMGVMVFYRSMNFVASSVDPVRTIILVFSGLTILFGMLLSLRISSRISKPIRKLTEVAKEYGKGNFDVRIESGTNDEVGTLTNAFNVMADDITANRQILLESIQAAEASSRAKSTFLATMSHEIRTPLNGVLGMADLLTNTQLDDRQARLVDTINNSGQNLLDIISDILVFSKIEAGKLELNHSAFNLSGLIENIGRLHAECAQKKGLEFICSIPPDISLLVEADEVRLRQVLTNLVSNAIKFTEKGCIEVRVVVLERANTKAQLRFEVTDTGIGLDQDNLGKIFQSFTQADGSTTKKFGGTGLGLAISQQLIGMMGSVIQVTSEIGKGTQFFFNLTLPAMKLPEENKHKNIQTLEGKRVLIVDDISTNRELLEQQLTAWRIPCDSVSTGQEGLKAIRQAQEEGNPYAIALLDYNMPEMDGLELAEAINTEATTKKIHLALLSCSSDIDTEQKAKHVGISAFLSKPVGQSDLYDLLVSIVDNDFECNSSESASKNSAKAFRMPPQIKARVLVAEDTLVNQDVVATMLDWFGCDFVVVSDGAEALKIVKEQKFDAILMDCQMPIMDGYEATKEIRTFEEKNGDNHIPIIALTANAIDGDRDQCLKAGMDDYMTKPFNQQQLGEVILKWVIPQNDAQIQDKIAATGEPLPSHLNLDPALDNTPVVSSHCVDKSSSQELEEYIESIKNEVILDSAVLDQFRQLQKPGRDDVVEKLMEAFFADSPRQIQNIIEAAEYSDAEALYKAAHALKSSSANLGAKRLFITCQIIEKIARKGTVDGTSCYVNLVQPTYQKTTDCLNEQQTEVLS